MTPDATGPEPQLLCKEIPTGWIRGEQGLAHVNPNYPAISGARIDRLEARIFDRLASDDQLIAAINALVEHYRAPLEELHTYPDIDDETSETNRQALAIIDRVANDIRDLAFALHPPDISPVNLYRFIAQVIFEDTGLGFGRMQPVSLMANISGEMRPVPLAPGQLAMIFTDASDQDRLMYTDLIRRMQVALGHEINRGGRPQRTDATPMPQRTDAQVVARLRRQGHTWPHIATILAAVFPEDDWDDRDDRQLDSLIQRVQRYAEAGKQLIGDDNGVSGGF